LRLREDSVRLAKHSSVTKGVVGSSTGFRVAGRVAIGSGSRSFAATGVLVAVKPVQARRRRSEVIGLQGFGGRTSAVHRSYTAARQKGTTLTFPIRLTRIG